MATHQCRIGVITIKGKRKITCTVKGCKINGWYPVADCTKIAANHARSGGN